jgi:phage RecT family recombinase
MNQPNQLMVVANTIASPETQAQVQRMLPKDVSIDRFTETAIAALQTRPELVECEKNSLYTAILRCAKDGLLPDGRQAAIVAFNTKVLVNGKETWVKKAQAMPMVEGVVLLLAKAGVSAYAVSVYANDKVRVWNDDTGQHFEHEPVTFGARGERLGAVAVGRDKHGHTWVEAMNMEDLEAPKRATKQKDRDGKLIGPWKETPDRMEQKSALHRLGKRIPNISIRDDEEFRDDPVAIVAPAVEPETPALAPPKKPTRPRALQRVIDQSAGTPADQSAVEQHGEPAAQGQQQAAPAPKQVEPAKPSATKPTAKPREPEAF